MNNRIIYSIFLLCIGLTAFAQKSPKRIKKASGPGIILMSQADGRFDYADGSLIGYGDTEIVFAPDAAVSPNTTGQPNNSEIEAWNNGLPGPHGDVIVEYTATDDLDDVATHIFYIDSGGSATLLESPGSPNNFGRRAVPGPVFADPNNPTEAEVLAYVDLIPGGVPPFTLLVQLESAVPGDGSSGNPETVWMYDGTDVTRVKDFPQKFEVPAGAFADTAAPLSSEVLTWMGSNPQAGNNLLAYFTGSGSAQEPDYIWMLAGDKGPATNIMLAKGPSGSGTPALGLVLASGNDASQLDIANINRAMGDTADFVTYLNLPLDTFDFMSIGESTNSGRDVTIGSWEYETDEGILALQLDGSTEVADPALANMVTPDNTSGAVRNNPAYAFARKVKARADPSAVRFLSSGRGGRPLSRFTPEIEPYQTSNQDLVNAIDKLDNAPESFKAKVILAWVGVNKDTGDPLGEATTLTKIESLYDTLTNHPRVEPDAMMILHYPDADNPDQSTFRAILRDSVFMRQHDFGERNITVRLFDAETYDDVHPANEAYDEYATADVGAYFGGPFTQLEINALAGNAGVTGSGTVGRLPMWTPNGTTLGDSPVYKQNDTLVSELPVLIDGGSKPFGLSVKNVSMNVPALEVYSAISADALLSKVSPASGSTSSRIYYNGSSLQALVVDLDSAGVNSFENFKVTRHNSSETLFEVNRRKQLGIGMSPEYALDAGAHTDGFRLPAGTSAQRPPAAALGLLRYNTTTGCIEGWNGSFWDCLVFGSDVPVVDPTRISDADGDTKVETERVADEDVVHIKAGGTDVASFYPTGLLMKVPRIGAFSGTDSLRFFLGTDRGVVFPNGNFTYGAGATTDLGATFGISQNSLSQPAFKVLATDNSPNAVEMTDNNGDHFFKVSLENGNEQMEFGKPERPLTHTFEGEVNINGPFRPNSLTVREPQLVTLAASFTATQSDIDVDLAASGAITFDAGKPDGTYLTFLNVAALGSGIDVTIVPPTGETWWSGTNPVLVPGEANIFKKRGTVWYTIN